MNYRFTLAALFAGTLCAGLFSACKKESKQHYKSNSKRPKVQKNDIESNWIHKQYFKQYDNNTKTKLYATTNEDVKKKDKQDT